MKNKLKFILSFLLLGIVMSAGANVVQTVDLRTGVVNGTANTLIGVGTADDTWSVKWPGGSTYQSTYSMTYSSWGTPTNCRWITPKTEPCCFNFPDEVPQGVYNYRMTFNTAQTCNILSARIVFNYTNSDNILDSFKVNNSFDFYYPLAGMPKPHFVNGAWVPSTNYVVNLNANDIVYGTNTIDFFIWNAPDGPWGTKQGFALDAYLEITYADQLTPSISGANAFCSNGAIYFTGDDGAANTATSHQWEILECDGSGNPNNPLNTWTSPNYPWAPGPFTFPALGFIQCTKYFLVKLTVSNACGTQTVTKIIYINCPPTVNAGNDVSICNGSCTTLIATGPGKGHTYNWYQQGDEPVWIGSGSQIVVCPTSTTMYCVTVTNNISGCSATDCITVTVETVNPSFSLNANTNPNTHFELTAIPNQTTNIPAGFGFEWILEEEVSPGFFIIVADRSNYFPNCWSTFPGNETFDGFNAITSVYNNTTCNPNPGMFKYNTTYRLTRGVWSAHCPWAQSTLLISYVKSAQGGIVITEDRNAPDFSWTMNAQGGHNVLNTSAEKLQVYPNPAKGVVNIAYTLGNDATGKINVTDVTGKLIRVINLSANDNRISIDLGDCQDGIYFIHLYTGGHLAKTEKMVIRH